MTINSSYILPDDSFENLKLAVFMGCETGYDGEGGKNLPTVVVNQGAEVAIGFKMDIDCSKSNIWIENFYESLLGGATVSQAARYATSQETSYLPFAEDNIVICGNENYILSE